MAAGDRGATFIPGQWNGYFSPWVMKNPGFDRWLMYLGINSAVVGGKPGVVYPGQEGDPGTYNRVIGTWWADRIWVTWHFGDGKDPAGWAEPKLLLDLGEPGSGEGALIGDPCVVYYGGKWHMYYGGVERADAHESKIFHAYAEPGALLGPWRKTGEVCGLIGRTDGQGFQWPTAFVDNHNVLRLYFSDGSARILGAYCTSPSGTCFTMSRFDEKKPFGPVNPMPVLPGSGNRLGVAKQGSAYYAAHDVFGWSKIRATTSLDPINWPAGTDLITPRAGEFDSHRVSRPCLLYADGEWRVYYTGKSEGGFNTIGYYVVGA